MNASSLGKVHFMPSAYDPETRAKAVRLVLEHSRPTTALRAGDRAPDTLFRHIDAGEPVRLFDRSRPHWTILNVGRHPRTPAPAHYYGAVRAT